VYDDTKNKNLT